MAFNRGFSQRDKFGNPFKVVGCRDKKGNGFPRGFVEINGKLYKLEPSKANKEGVDVWIRVTQVQSRSNQGGQGF